MPNWWRSGSRRWIWATPIWRACVRVAHTHRHRRRMQELRGYGTTTAAPQKMAIWLRHWGVGQVVTAAASIGSPSRSPQGREPVWGGEETRPQPRIRRMGLAGARYPVAVESGGHSMRQLDAGDVLQGLRMQNR